MGLLRFMIKAIFRFGLFSYFSAVTLHAQGLIWPTDASQIMTSSFGEYRSGHFHAGIDFKTWNRTGYKVFAIGNGSVVRVRVSPYGYGRAVYLKLENGNVAVYAHLSKFSDHIESIVKREQKRLERFSIDKHFVPGAISVVQGEILGYTGRSGTRDPHLHFEIRDGESRPFNPLFLGYSFEDSVPPSVTAVAASPLSFGSHVSGDFQPGVFQVERQNPDQYVLNQPITAWGRIGLAVAAFDRADGASNRFAPYRARLFVDDYLVFSTRYDRFSYGRTGQIELDREYRLKVWGLGLFQRLYRAKGNQLSFYEPASQDAGILACWDEKTLDRNSGMNERVDLEDAEFPLSLNPGDHRIRIEVTDYSGNSTEVAGLLRMVPIYEVASQMESGDRSEADNLKGTESSPKIKIEPHFYEEYIRFRLLTDKELSEAPILFAGFHAWDKDYVPLIQISDCEFVGAMAVEEGEQGILTADIQYLDFQDRKQMQYESWPVFSITSNSGGTIRSSDGRFTAIFPRDAVYRSLITSCSVDSFYHPSGIIGWKYSLYPQDIPFRKSVKVAMDASLYAGEKEKLGVYRVDVGGNVSYLGSQWEADWITARTGGFSGFTILMDTTAPEIYFVFPDSGAHMKDRTPRIAVGFRDTLSGVSGEKNYILSLDGSRLIVEYDPVHRMGFHPVEEPLTSGRHVLVILIRDQAGNVAVRQSRFIIE